ncbi:uncharacterized protein EV422DRAFT_544993 [Fimicolochytrium jonesii]|uniref:uncharacterized protein n=1 Tax=Fimicolochytrium jonesii TaxID=1396493 RepID=UPI0022FF0186|nr:uncharacterized protein EV422DRAFT_544993 [Fimicolochytrium jonesii]KAI8816623.1 hypothetical protein EV422DRAFT_544993 [Fimicolochytrium jonesii]
MTLHYPHKTAILNLPDGHRRSSSAPSESEDYWQIIKSDSVSGHLEYYDNYPHMPRPQRPAVPAQSTVTAAPNDTRITITSTDAPAPRPSLHTHSAQPPTKQNHQDNMPSVATLDEPMVGGPGNAYDFPTSRNGPATFITLKPVAPPSALGLASYASAVFVTGTWLAAWYGDNTTPFMLWPFILCFGGFGQFGAGMWSFNARDTLATVFHTMWGSFWIAISLYLAFIHPQVDPALADGRYEYNDAWAIWMVPLSAITYVLTAAALFRDLVWAGTLFTLATGALFGVLGWFIHEPALVKLTGYLWIASSLFALYRVALFLFHEAVPQRDLLPRFDHRTRRRDGANNPHAGYNNPKDANLYNHGYGEPGVVANGWHN